MQSHRFIWLLVVGTQKSSECWWRSWAGMLEEVDEDYEHGITPLHKAAGGGHT
jgi:hypothetical protein